MDSDLRFKVAMLESQVLQLQQQATNAKYRDPNEFLEIAFPTIEPDMQQRVFGGSGGGGGTVGPLRHQIRVVKRDEATYLDIYLPQHSRVNNFVDLGDGWYQILDLTSVTEENLALFADVRLLLSTQEALNDEDYGKTHYIIHDPASGLYYNPMNGTSANRLDPAPPSDYASLTGVILFANLRRYEETVDGQTNVYWTTYNIYTGEISVIYASMGAEALYVQAQASSSNPSGLVTLEALGRDLKKSDTLYLCKKYGLQVYFGESKIEYQTEANPVCTDADGKEKFVSSLEVTMHAADHYDGFIPMEE